MIKGKLLSTVYELMQEYLSIVTNFTAGSGLANQIKLKSYIYKDIQDPGGTTAAIRHTVYSEHRYTRMKHLASIDFVHNG